MTAFASLLADPDRILASVRASALEPIKLRAAVSAMGAEDLEHAVEETAALQARVRGQVLSGGSAGISLRDIKAACRTYLHPPSPPGRELSVGTPLLDEVARRGRRSPLIALIDSYLDGFDAEDDDIMRLAERLERFVKDWAWREYDPWPARAEKFSLFQPAKAPKAIGQAVLDASADPLEILAGAGLDTDGRRRGGLGQAAFAGACLVTERATGQIAVKNQVRLIQWACPDGSGKEFMLPSAWPQFAGALLIPWTNAPPDKEHQKRVTELAIEYAGDPRTMGAKWRQVETAKPEALATLKRWLVRASVLQFFDIVDSTADDRMWRYRRSFWKSYVDAGHVDDAWVVFGSDGARRAREAARRSGEASMTMFGQLEAGGGRGADQSALLLRIGDLTIAEWSHNGRCYMWRRGERSPPRLGEKRYHADDLRHDLPSVTSGKRVGIAHMHADSYRWQRNVMQVIFDETGLKTKQADWRP